MKIKLECEQAYHNNRMRIMCQKTQALCGHQWYKPCKGWCVLTDGYKNCPVRKEKK